MQRIPLAAMILGLVVGTFACTDQAVVGDDDDTSEEPDDDDVYPGSGC